MIYFIVIFMLVTNVFLFKWIGNLQKQVDDHKKCLLSAEKSILAIIEWGKNTNETVDKIIHVMKAFNDAHEQQEQGKKESLN